MTIFRALAVLSLGISAWGQTIPNAVLLPGSPLRTWLDQNGRPLAGAKVCFYVSGTSSSGTANCPDGTPLDTYTDATAAYANANPVVLDSAGRARVFLGGGKYKIVVKTSQGVLVGTEDPVYDPSFSYLRGLTTVGSSALITNVAPGTGAITRSVSDKLSESLSVKDFGAIGDGTSHPVSEWCTNHGGTRYTAATDGACLTAVQADYPLVAAITEEIDNTAIVAAMTAICSTHGSLYFSSGIYLTEPISLCASITIYGAGPKASIVKSKSGAVVFDLTTSAYHDVTIHDLGFLGLGSGTGTGYAIYAHALSGDPQAYRFYNLDVQSMGGGVIKILDHVLYNSEFSNITATVLGNDGIYVYSMITTAAFDSIFVGQIDTAGKAAFRIINGLFNCNHCNGVNTPTEYGMILGAEPTLDGGLSGTVVLNCTNCNFEAFAVAGIHFRNGSYGNLFVTSLGCDYANVVALEYRYQPDTAVGGFYEGSRIRNNGGSCSWKNSYAVHGSIIATSTRPPFINYSTSLAGAANYAWYNDAVAAVEYLPTIATKRVLVGSDNYFFIYFPDRVTTDYMTLPTFQVFDPTSTTGTTGMEIRNGAGQSTTPVLVFKSAAGTSQGNIGSDASATFDQFILANTTNQRGRIIYNASKVQIDTYNKSDFKTPFIFKSDGGYEFSGGLTGTPASFACFTAAGLLVSSPTACVP